MSRKPEFELYEAEPKLNEVKIYLCHLLKKSMRKRGFDQARMAFRLSTSRARVHEIENLKIEKLTVGQLMQYLARSEPHFELLISF